MNEPQIWTLIGVFGAALFGMLTLMSTMFVRIVRTEIRSVHTEIGSVRNEMESIRHEVTGVHRRIDRLDGDINALMRHTFGAERE